MAKLGVEICVEKHGGCTVVAVRRRFSWLFYSVIYYVFKWENKTTYSSVFLLCFCSPSKICQNQLVDTGHRFESLWSVLCVYLFYFFTNQTYIQFFISFDAIL